MKSLLLAILLSPLISLAQNTFPASGNVGIGITPGAPLSVYNPTENLAVPVLRISSGTGSMANSGGTIAFFTGTEASPMGRIYVQNQLSEGVSSIGKLILGSYTSVFNDELTLYGGNVGIGTTSPAEVLDAKGNPVFGTATERLSMASMCLGFNRRVATGAIYDNTHFAYQFTHTGSNSQTVDFLGLQVYSPSGGQVTPSALVINGAAQVGINTSFIPPTYQLAVNGSVIATSMTVQLRSVWPDYIFEKGYLLPTLIEIKAYINQYQHLPGVPSADQIKQDGQNLGDLQKVQMQKIEELTLYAIDADRHGKDQDTLISRQEVMLSQLQEMLKVQQQEIDQLKQQVNAIEGTSNAKPPITN